MQAETATRCQVDAGVAKNKAQFEANETYGANANGQTLVILDLDREGAHGGDEGRATRDAQALASGANWRFNGEVVPTEKTEKKDIAELKGRMQSELERRGDEERRKSVDVAQEEKSRADASKVAAKEMAKQEAAPDDATVRYDENRNNLLLNDRLRRVQTVQRQLGTDAGGAGGGAGGGVVAAPPRVGGGGRGRSPGPRREPRSSASA